LYDCAKIHTQKATPIMQASKLQIQAVSKDINSNPNLTIA